MLRCEVSSRSQVADGVFDRDSLDSLIIHPEDHVGATEGTIEMRSRLGGVLNYYHRKAA